MREKGIDNPEFSWEGSYCSWNHGMNYHPYRYLKLSFIRGERTYEFEFSNNPYGDGRYAPANDARQMANVVFARIENAVSETIEGVLGRDQDNYDWEVGYDSLEDFLNEHIGKKIRIQVIEG